MIAFTRHAGLDRLFRATLLLSYCIKTKKTKKNRNKSVNFTCLHVSTQTRKSIQATFLLALTSAKKKKTLKNKMVIDTYRTSLSRSSPITDFFWQQTTFRIVSDKDYHEPGKFRLVSDYLLHQMKRALLSLLSF